MRSPRRALGQKPSPPGCVRVAVRSRHAPCKEVTRRAPRTPLVIPPWCVSVGANPLAYHPPPQAAPREPPALTPPPLKNYKVSGWLNWGGGSQVRSQGRRRGGCTGVAAAAPPGAAAIRRPLAHRVASRGGQHCEASGQPRGSSLRLVATWPGAASAAQQRTRGASFFNQSAAPPIPVPPSSSRQVKGQATIPGPL